MEKGRTVFLFLFGFLIRLYPALSGYVRGSRGFLARTGDGHNHWQGATPSHEPFFFVFAEVQLPEASRELARPGPSRRFLQWFIVGDCRRVRD